jgi:periplasmic protein CpxP/Spy
MKQIFLILSTVLFAVSSFAHDSAKVKKTPEQMAAKRADKLKSELGLSDVQRSSVYSAILEKINQTRQIKQTYKDSANRKGREKAIRSVREQFDSRMNTILTPEQKTKYEALRKQEMDRDDDGDVDADDKRQKKQNKSGKGKKSGKD